MIARRTWWAAGLLTAALTALLVGWFLSGWSDVRARQAAVRARPITAAVERSTGLARELQGELTNLLARELARPYFHYQSLFRDPRASASIAVSPSPLAAGSPEPLVRGYFQIDSAGRATTPTVNDEVPALSEPTQLAGNTAFRAQVIASLAAPLRPPSRPALVTDAAPPPPSRPVRRPRPPVQVAQHEPTPQHAAVPQQAEPQQQQLSRNAYAQNRISNSIYLENAPSPQAQRSSVPPKQAPSSATPATVNLPPKPTARPRPAASVVATIAAVPNENVTILVSPFQLATQPFAGGDALVATRAVDTPDEALTQGFVIDREAVATWIAARGGDAAFEYRASADLSPGAVETPVLPGWVLATRAEPVAVAQANRAADRYATAFLVRFVLLGLVALFAAGLVVMLVSRSEQLARERSQFAAAAAHELRTPLAGLQLYGDMLAEGLGDPDKQRDYAKRMAEEAARLGRVVSNVLGFSQLERGNLSVEARDQELSAELATLAARAEPALDRAGAVLALDVASDLRAKFDRDAVARIVSNLLDNAEKYGRGADDRTITLAAKRVDATVEIRVSDHGPGVDAAARGTLFRAFVRGVGADGPAGLGLGLALSQSLARAMGGELTYTPHASGGASFVLRLAA